MPLPAVPLLCAVLFASPIPPQNPPGQETGLEGVEVPEGALEEEGEFLVLKFDETEEGGLTIRQFIKICQINTGLNFTFDQSQPQLQQQLERKILLYGEKKIRKKDFYSFFQILMKINGFVTVPQGSGDLEVIMITPVNATTTQTIKSGAVFVSYEDVETFKDQPAVWIVTVVPLEFAEAQGLGTSLRTALSGGGPGTGQDAFMPLPTENALLIQGFGPFVASTVRLVRLLDREPKKAVPVREKIQLQEASAEDVADLLQDLLEEQRTPGAPRVPRPRGGADTRGNEGEIPTKIVPYPRDNSLIVSASQENLERIKDLVAWMDTRIEVPETNFRIYQLKNISAKELASDLQDFLQRTQQAEEQAARTAGQGGGGAGQNQQTEQRIVLVEQEETNSLLITATRTKWAELERLLDKLDQRQPQVLIETALIEVSGDFARDIGLEYANVNPPSGNAQKGFGFTSVGISTLLDQDGDGIPDTRVPDSTRTGITAGILDGQDFGIPILLAAAETRNDTNILSIPSILVTNNRGARVESLDEIPVTEQTPVQNVGITESFSGFQEAGIKLEITPSISSKEYLRLDVNLEISAFRGAFTGGTIPPPRATRTLATTVHLPHGATMWIGGIISDNLSVDETGIPFLSDIPVIGWIFGRTQSSNTKTTLFFFVTPRIMDDFEELRDVSEGGKSRAADVIGLERLRRIDPKFRFKKPLDIIMEEDLNGDGQDESGMIDLSSFSAPSFVTSGGFVTPEEVGVDPSDVPRTRVVPATPPEGKPRTLPVQRNLPESKP